MLIAWQHERIPKIADHILGEDGQYPTKWDPARFDLVWVFDRQGDDDSWSFLQVPQLLLPGDPDPILRQTANPIDAAAIVIYLFTAHIAWAEGAVTPRVSSSESTSGS